MTFRLRRAASSVSLLALLVAGLPLAAHAERAPSTQASASAPLALASQKRPWLYADSDVPIDAAWRFGVLPNGLRYAVRRNGVPPGQIAIRLRVDAGSLMEKPDELGYAHFMEHLSMRGSKHVPDGESKRIWQRLGVTFGSDSNAQTTPTGTTYALDLPQASPASLDESLKILAGMMTEPNIIDAAVNAERAVVLAEMREGTGLQSRVGDATRMHFFAGQLLASRSPIGTTETLNSVSAAKMEAFHARWYRPENAVISIAGDADPAMLEEALKKAFSSWTAEGKSEPLPDFGDPDPKQPMAAVVVEPGAPIGLSMGWLRPWRPRSDTIVYNQRKLTDMLALQMINRRLEQAARAGGAFISASVEQQDVSRSVDGTFISIMPVGNDWKKALEQVRGIIEDAKDTAPTQAEIDREYAQFDTALAIGVENEDTEAGAKQASDLASAVDIRETVVTPQAALDIFRSGKPTMTPETMLDSTRRLFSADVTRALLIMPTAVPGTRDQLEAALATQVAAARNVRLAEGATTIEDLPKFGPAGTVVAREPSVLPGMETITFSNGVKLMLFANSAETGKVRINVRFGHGQQDFSPTRKVPSWAASYALVASGIGKLGQRELDDLTNGRRLGMDFSIDDDAFELAAVTRPADYDDQLKLLATKLAFPGWDPAPIGRLKAGLAASFDTLSTSPDGVMTRELSQMLRGGDVRFRTPDKTEIAALTPQDFRKTWEPILASGPIEVQIFGDVKADEAIARVAETFGALPPRKERPVPAANRIVRFPAHIAKPIVLRHSGDKEQAAAVMAWPTSGGFAASRESRQLEILTQIFNDRLFEGMRATDGAAYSPSVSNNWPFAFDSGGYILVSSQVKPEKLDYFFKLIDQTAADLVANPVSADELQRAVAPMRQLLSRASTGNAFWMSQLEGATRDPRYADVTRSMGADLLSVTAADVQALAGKYLVPGKSWSAEVLPEGIDP